MSCNEQRQNVTQIKTLRLHIKKTNFKNHKHIDIHGTIRNEKRMNKIHVTCSEITFYN